MTKIIKKSKLKKISSTSYKHIQSGGDNIKFKYKQIRKTIQDNRNENILTIEESLFGIAKVEKLSLISFRKNSSSNAYTLKDTLDTINCTNRNVFSFEDLLNDVFEEKTEIIKNINEKYQYLCFGNYLKLDVSEIFSENNKGKNNKYSYFDLDNREDFLKPIKIDGNFFRFYALKAGDKYYTINNYLEFTNEIIYTIDEERYLCSAYPAQITEIIFQTKLNIDFDDYMSKYFKCEKIYKNNNINFCANKIELLCSEQEHNNIDKYKLSDTIQDSYNLNKIDLSKCPDIVSMSSSSFHRIYKSLDTNTTPSLRNLILKNKLRIIVNDKLQKEKINLLLNPNNIETTIIIKNNTKVSIDIDKKNSFNIYNKKNSFKIYNKSNQINTVFFIQDKINLKKKDFQEINNIKIRDTKFLFLKDNRSLQRIHPNAFKGFINLKAINLSKSFIFKINSNTFQGCEKLRFIDLSHCVYLSCFDENAFIDLQNCIIDCRNSLNLVEIHSDAFKGCTNITIFVNQCVEKKIKKLPNVKIQTFYEHNNDNEIYPQKKYNEDNNNLLESYKNIAKTNKEVKRRSALTQKQRVIENISACKQKLLEPYESFNIQNTNEYLKAVLTPYNINIMSKDPIQKQKIDKIIRMSLAKKESINETQFNNFTTQLDVDLTEEKKNLDNIRDDLLKNIKESTDIIKLFENINNKKPIKNISKDWYKILNNRFSNNQKILLSKEKYGKKFEYFKEYNGKLKFNQILFSKIMTGSLNKRGPSSRLIQSLENSDHEKSDH